MADNQLSFKIKSGLKNIIGRDLITDDYVAVFELVKNSFDAYAKKVTISFQKNKITITDDGKGMSLDDINEKWLAVAYSAKKEGIEDDELSNKEFESYRDKINEKKFFAGAKGIGRFSCDRLGSKLILTSKKAATNSKLEQIEVDWSDFEKDSKDEFINIKVKHRTIQATTKEYKNLNHGTILEISSLNSSWDRNKKLNLKYSLEKLINPFKENPLNGFSIFIQDENETKNDSPKKDKRTDVNGEVKNFVFETLELKTTQILTEIDSNGEFITTSISDRGTLIYKIRRKNNATPKLKNIKIHIFYLNRVAKTNFTRLMGIQPVYFGSIFLYKNGFRIAPYGDFGVDYFGIDSRHAQALFRTLGLRDLIGRIEIIGDELNHFTEVSNRNGGLVKNDYYNTLEKIFIKDSLTKLENYITGVLWTSKEDKNFSDLSALSNIKAKSALLSLISNEIDEEETELVDVDKNNLNIRAKELLQEAKAEDIEALKLIAKKLGDKSFNKETTQAEKDHNQILELQQKLAEEEALKLIAEEEKRKLEEQLEIEREKNTFLRITSRGLGDDAKGLVHNIKHTSKNISSSVEMLIAKIKTGNYKEKDIFDRLLVIKFNNEKVLKIAKLITRANFRTDENSQVIDIVKYITQYIGIYDDIFDKNKLKIICQDTEISFIKRVSALDLALIFDDLISNSEKASAKTVEIDFVNKDPNELSIFFSDNGKGVSEKFIKNPDGMFELGISEGTVDGSGIGLYAVRKTLKAMHGQIEFIGNGVKLKGATFKISIAK